MRVVQALQWLRSMTDSDHDRISRRLAAILAEPDHGCAIATDLRDGLTKLPEWMQRFLQPLLEQPAQSASQHKRPKPQN
jgi:hypothetical protein